MRGKSGEESCPSGWFSFCSFGCVAVSGGAASSHEQPPASDLAIQEGPAPAVGSGAGSVVYVEGCPKTLDSHGEIG